MKILLIGNGFVGKATYLLNTPENKFYVYDVNPKLCVPLGFYPKNIKDYDLVFICLPTPMNVDGTCNTDLIKDAIKKFPHPFTIVRSTVPIGFCDEHNVYFMPEFLTEKEWKQDFISTPIWYYGYPSYKGFTAYSLNGSAKAYTFNGEQVKRKLESRFQSLIKSAYMNKNIDSCDIKSCTTSELEFVKYIKNSLLSTKVTFFNELYPLVQKYNINYQIVEEILKQDPRIGLSHMQVPGPDGKFGYGGTCFPKDTLSLYYQIDKAPLLEANLNSNESLYRPKRDWLKDVDRSVVSNHKKIALVTGGAGFLGSHLCEKLLEKNMIVICVDNLITGSITNISQFLSNPNFKFLKKSVINKLFIPHVDEIYHLAGIASPPKYKSYPLETLQVSIQGTINMLEMAVKHSAKFLFTSTSEVYGDPLEHPQKETYWGHVNTVGERSCYDEGKRVAETLIYEYRKKYNLNAKIVRIFNTYGPNMDIDDGRIVTNIIKSIKNNRPVTIYGDGSQTRSFAYVSDTINGVLMVMESNILGPINIGNPQENTINELLSIFNSVTGKELKVEYIEKSQDDPYKRNPDITLISKLGWKPDIDLISGLKMTINYFEHLNISSKL